MKELERIKEFGGWLKRFEHASTTCQCTMTFSIYLPPLAETEAVPVVYWLSGLTCTDDNFRTKAGAQRYASELDVALVIPDTSPRGEGVADCADRYDLGCGAGFYINATQEPWATHYNMFDYITEELPSLIEANFPVIGGLKSIMGHSMGGHGALICALKKPHQYQSVSAFAPICNPAIAGWGKGIFSEYLGDNKQLWNEYDATQLIGSGCDLLPIFIDQGTDDEFLAEQLFPQNLAQAVKERNGEMTLRYQEGYDHSYHFIGTFIGEHLTYHSQALRSKDG